jgi:hypothetical protein
METGIRSIEIKKDREGEVSSVHLVFGPHYFLDLQQEDGQLIFYLGAAHHGFRADASEIGNGLEEMIESIREAYSQSRFD